MHILFISVPLLLIALLWIWSLGRQKTLPQLDKGLFQAKESAKEASRHKSRFLGGSIFWFNPLFKPAVSLTSIVNNYNLLNDDHTVTLSTLESAALLRAEQLEADAGALENCHNPGENPASQVVDQFDASIVDSCEGHVRWLSSMDSKERAGQNSLIRLDKFMIARLEHDFSHLINME